MKKFLTVAVASVLLLAGGSVAYANICAFDPVPAATLLFPFVSYNYNGGDQGQTTLFAITNVSSDAQIVHITLWTDYSVPVIDWNVVLTGYDVYTFNIRDILKYGKIEGSQNRKADADDGVLDQGPVSYNNPAVTNMGGPHWDGPFDVPGNNTGMGWPESTWGFNSGAPDFLCDSQLNEAYPGAFLDPDFEIDEQILLFFQNMLQGSQAGKNWYNDCTGADYLRGEWFDNRGLADDTFAYLTADVVNTCNKLFPDEANYWNQGIVMDYNVLMGDVIWVNQEMNYSELSNAVHLEATDLDGIATPGPNGYPISFYGRYANNFGYEDNREPLPTAWAFRYISHEVVDTKIRAFKASTNTRYPIVPDLVAALTSPNQLVSKLTALNCMAYTVYIWDEEENIDYTPVDDPPYSGGEEEIRGVQPNLLPLETQEVDASEFNLVGDSGWMLFVWPASNRAWNYEDSNRELYYQTWMGVKYITEGADTKYSGATDGAVMANYNCFAEQILDWGLGIDYQYVEDGRYVRWTGSSE